MPEKLDSRGPPEGIVVIFVAPHPEGSGESGAQLIWLQPELGRVPEPANSKTCPAGLER